MDRHAIRIIIGICGNVMSVLLFISPMPTFRNIIKRKDVEAYSPNPYLAMVLNCALWVFYGMPFINPNSILVVSTNSVGLFLGFVYCGVYLAYAHKTTKRLFVLAVLVGIMLFVAGIAALALKVLHTTNHRGTFVGIVCVIFNILMYAMPLDVVRLVVRTKSVEYMPFFLLLANFINGGIWLAYALIGNPIDIFIAVSNGTGCILGLIQLTVYACYYKTTPKHGDLNRNELELSEEKHREVV